MTLALTNYASLLPSYVSGIIKAYSTISDPLVTSGFLKRDIIEWTPYDLDGGVSCNRMPLFSSETVTDVTRFNRAGFQRNVIKEVTMDSRTFKTSASGAPTFGALDDPRKLSRGLNLANPSLQDAEYVRDMVAGHTMAAFWDYYENFVGMIFANCTIKSDYDYTTGPGGAVVTFANDVPYAPYVMTTDLNNVAVSYEDRAMNLVKELRRAVAPMMKYNQGQPMGFMLSDSCFTTFREFIEYYKTKQAFRRYQDTEIGGTFNALNTNVFNLSDMYFMRYPDTNFPTTGANNAFRCLAIAPDAIRIKISQADLTNGINLFNSTLQSVNMGNLYDYAQNNFSQATFTKVMSYMGMDPRVSSMMENGSMGGNVIPNLFKVYTDSVSAASTDINAGYAYTYVRCNMAVLRSNPYALREFQVDPALIELSPPTP